jgi:hypothetical protein
MDVKNYEDNKHKGQVLFFAGIITLFKNIDYAKHLGLVMVILGLIIIFYNRQQINNKKKQEKINEIIDNFNNKIIQFFKDNQTEPIIEKPINIIKTFEKKYNINQSNNININNINIIITYDINYDKITLFLDIYMFVINMKNIIDMNIEINYVHNNLLIDYYKYYNDVISYISNLNDETEISIALSNLIDDYNDNAKNLNIIFNYNGKYIIKYILKELINIINENVIIKFNKFSALY